MSQTDKQAEYGLRVLSVSGDADVGLAETSTSVLGHQCGLDLGLACYLLFEQIQHKQMRNLVSCPDTLQERPVLPDDHADALQNEAENDTHLRVAIRQRELLERRPLDELRRIGAHHSTSIAAPIRT